jgi:hypothetical protein
VVTRKDVLARVVREVEDRLYRPLFFAVVIPPALVWDWWTRRKMEQQPKTLEEAVEWLKQRLAGERQLLSEFMRAPERDMAVFHHGLGRKVRNELHLWDDPKPPLWHHFVDELNIDHPDDMSGLIMTTLHRHLNGRPLDIAAQCCRYHEYWAAFADRNPGVNMQGPDES